MKFWQKTISNLKEFIGMQNEKEGPAEAGPFLYAPLLHKPTR